MGAPEPVEERENEEMERREQESKESQGEGEGEGEEDAEVKKDVEKGEVGLEGQAIQTEPPGQFHMSRMQRLSATNPLRLVIDAKTRVPTVSTYQPRATPSPSPAQQPQPQPQPRSAPPTQSRHLQQQPSITTLNSRAYTNKISLFVFLLHVVVAFGLMCFLVFKGVQGLLESGYIERKEKRVLTKFLPQVEVASLMSITLALVWQKAVRLWPKFMVHFIPWCTFIMSLSAGILLICFQKPPTDGVGVVFIAFAIGNGLYACWVSRRIGFCSKVLIKSLEPVSKFPDLNQPTYWMLGGGFMWMSLWILAVVGSLNFYLTPVVIILLGLSLAWIAEVMRNVANITVSRVIALYYLRGMQSNTQFCFQRALSKNLGSACLGSLFVPGIETLRIVARVLNLLEGEDEFMFSCAHCCLSVMEAIFRYGNGWAYVQIASYGKDFVRASQDTWELFKKREMEAIVDSDLISAICFLTGVCSGSMCVIVVAAWTSTIHQSFTASVSLLAFYVGYLMTRIAMALPHACVSCYYVCYAEDPENRRFFDKTISDRLNLMKSGRDVVVPTPRVPR